MSAIIGNSCDLLVIGAGPGGYIAAIRAAQNGLKTVVVDKDERPGGTCLLRGCIPTKALLEAASLFESVQGAAEFGVMAERVRFDWAQVNRRKAKVVEKNSNGVRFLFRKNHIEQVAGSARLAGAGEVEVTAADGQKRRLSARHVLIASGSAPRLLGLAPPDGRRVFTSDELLEIDEVPRSLVVVGAGAVGVEFASIYQRFGAKVTLVEMLPRLAPLEDHEVSAELERCFRRRKVEIRTSTSLADVQVGADEVELTLQAEGKPSERVRAQALLVAVGRRPVSENLGLEEIAGVQVESGYVQVDGLCRTGAPWLSAIGDVVRVGGRPHPQLAHIASAEGVLVADRLAGKPVEPIDYDRQTINATFSDPEIASVGYTEARARERFGAVRVGKFPYQAIGKAAVTGRHEGFIKVVAAEEHDELLGVHIIGERATELIHEAAVALRLESTSEELWRTIHAHPTLSEGVMEAAHAVGGKALGA